MSTELTKVNQDVQIMPVDLAKELPDLSQAEEFPFDLCGDYWTPDLPGESKLLFYAGINKERAKSYNSDDIIDLECATFIERLDKTNSRKVICGSRKLVGILEGLEEMGRITIGTPLKITFMGTKKMSKGLGNNWSIKPLIIKI